MGGEMKHVIGGKAVSEKSENFIVGQPWPGGGERF
jgi:hypothetical protein